MASTVVVLGAGASRGAEFVKETYCKPPLNNDFFTQLQRISSDKHVERVRATINDVVGLFGVNWSITLEDYFTQIEFFSKAVKLTGERRITSADLRAARDNLLQALAALLEESMSNNTCCYHQGMIEKLSSGDTIISFNYDCLIDYCLMVFGAEKWNPRYGYRFPLRRGWRLTGDEHWRPSGDPVRQNETIQLLKLHGSIHWQIPTVVRRDSVNTISLKQRLYHQNGNLIFSIIPPEWNKDATDNPVFNRIWQQAAVALSRASTLVFVGHSFALTDLHSSALFRLAVGRNKLQKVIIVNPDQGSRQRTREIISGALGKKTLIIQSDSLEEFSSAGYPGM